MTADRSPRATRATRAQNEGAAADGPRPRSDRFAEYRRTRDTATRNAIIEDHLALAEHVVRRYARADGGPHDGREDIRQIALVGLVKAVERFDPSFGLTFSTFAVPTIAGEIKRHFRDRDWAVRVPRRLQELHLEIERASSRLTQELRRAPTISELARALDATEEEILEGMEAARLRRLPSLDARLDGDGDAVGTRIGADDPGVAAVDDRLVTAALLGALDERARQILYLRFFEELTQAQIAARIGISQMHVSRVLARSLGRLEEHAGTTTV